MNGLVSIKLAVQHLDSERTVVSVSRHTVCARALTAAPLMRSNADGALGVTFSVRDRYATYGCLSGLRPALRSAVVAASSVGLSRAQINNATSAKGGASSTPGCGLKQKRFASGLTTLSVTAISV